MGKWKYNPQAFLMSALNGGRCLHALAALAALLPGKGAFGAYQQDAGWALEPVWM